MYIAVLLLVRLQYSIAFLVNYQCKVPSSGATFMNSRATLNNHTSFMKTHWIASITYSHVARCLWLRLVTEGFCLLPPTKFSKCVNMSPWPSIFFKQKKIDVVRQSFNWKLISSSMSRDTTKHQFHLCMSQIFTVLVGKFWGNLRWVFLATKSLCLKSPHFDGVTLNNFGCVYLKETHVQWSSCFHIQKREAVLWW